MKKTHNFLTTVDSFLHSEACLPSLSSLYPEFQSMSFANPYDNVFDLLTNLLIYINL